MTHTRENTMPDFCNRRNPFHYTTAINLLISKGIDPDGIDLLAVGEYENYKGEVRSQKPEPGVVLRSDTRILLEVGFSSAVDVMPYQFFYGLRGRKAGAQWETAARHLMAPFDGAVIRHESIARYLALRYNFAVQDSDHVRQYMKLFDFDLEVETGDSSMAQVWAALLPVFNEWSGNPTEVEKVLARVFGYRFRIIENTEWEFAVPSEMRYTLGSKTGRLGHESVIGATFSERDTSYCVQIHGIRQEDVHTFLPGGRLRGRLEKILALCMPSHFNYSISFITTGRGIKIGDRQTGAFLGFATRL